MSCRRPTAADERARVRDLVLLLRAGGGRDLSQKKRLGQTRASSETPNLTA
jgi:hypothetical protein